MSLGLEIAANGVNTARTWLAIATGGAFLLASAPDSKAALSLDHAFRTMEAALRVTRWGEVRLVDWIDEEDVYEAAYTVDAALTWHAGRFATPDRQVKLLGWPSAAAPT